MNRAILVIGPSWIGDMVMAHSLFITLQEDARAAGQTLAIDVLAPAWSQPLLARMPEVRQAIHLPFRHGELNLKGRYQLGSSLRKQGYDQVIVLPNSFKSALIAFFSRVPLRTGWRGESRGPLLNDMRTLDEKALPMMVQRFVALARPAGQPLPSPLARPTLKASPEGVEEAVQAMGLKRERPVLILCPGAEFGDAKQWPAEHFAELASTKLLAGWQAWILGSAKDQEVASQIQSLLHEDAMAHCHDLTGITSLEQAIDLMSCASAVITNDSGLMHIAAALGKPIVAFYGSTSADFTPPLADNVQLLSRELDCRPCFERRCPLTHKRCLVDITPAIALEALHTLLATDTQPISPPLASSSGEGPSAGERSTFCES